MNDQIDSSIPVLTEVILPPGSEPVAPKKVAAPTTTQANTARAPTPMTLAPQALIRENTAEATSNIKPAESDTALAPEPGSDDWLLLEQTVRENVLKQVLSRIDFVLEHRVSDSLADVLQNAVDQLADDIRAGLKQSIEEVVTRAVNQELAKIKGTRELFARDPNRQFGCFLVKRNTRSKFSALHRKARMKMAHIA